NPEFQAFLVNVGARKRGWCGHWAQDIGTRLKELKPKTLVLHWGVAYDHTSSENNCLVVTARNQPFKDGIILDGWRRAGRLFWCPVIKDDEYEVEQHYGHSGITAWKENMQWSAWLQDYEPGKPKTKAKMAANNKATKVGYEVDLHERRADPREGNIVGGRSINLAISTRGIHALEQIGIADEALRHAIPMRGRMIHDKAGALHFAPYDVDPKNCINSIGRA